ncbi:Na+/H+ antiporter NhaC family protein [Mucisphaera calidilacus]|uniref:Malate-2H(+)/Na(+)-lactate antiporter n=1 Tax=Mucisphaera calidilacus TaxID=2527982 RepID=A0A518BTN6_9BACT|nr:Na+/H+ antiporter NhaC family protein [Mucisphaera calidilacus]QDU70336.1 Malate-2H(+)/Na(+)-lactate antiporter [Mucisphaera calidilacus]
MSTTESRSLAARIKHPGIWLFAACMTASLLVGLFLPPAWVSQSTTLDAYPTDDGSWAYILREKETSLADAVPYTESPITPANLEALVADGQAPAIKSQIVFRETGETRVYLELRAYRHWHWWSLLPAFTAILLCVATREPLTALLGGVLSGVLLLGRYNIVDDVLKPTMVLDSVTEVILLYCGLLGALVGIWARSGAAQAFAEWAARSIVTGPKTAKFLTWLLGVCFFQGGTISTVMVGATARPIADREKVSHEELSYVVDSTASPIAALIPFNAWPAYVQGLIFVPGVAFLATESSRMAFYFASIFLSFYALFAVIGTLLLSFEKLPFIGRRFRDAITRARTTGQLNAPGSEPLSSQELENPEVPEGHIPSLWSFVLPLALLIATALGTYFATGSPDVTWAFFIGLIAAIVMELARGLALTELVDGVGLGIKAVALAAVILVTAIMVGNLSKDAGGAAFLVSLLGESIHYVALPLGLLALTMIISFSTGTSWGTYAVAFPLGMPLAWAVAQSHDLANPQLYMMVCFATILNGSLYGDQCSPISDTTVLSSMVSGADLMDHVRTQIVPASVAMGLAAFCWTATVWIFC